MSQNEQFQQNPEVLINPYETIASEQQAHALDEISTYVSQGNSNIHMGLDRTQGVARSWSGDDCRIQGAYDPTTGTTYISKITDDGRSYEKLSFLRDSDTGLMSVTWSASSDINKDKGAKVVGTEWNIGGEADDIKYPSLDGTRNNHTVTSAVSLLVNSPDAPAPVKAKALEASQAVTNERLSALLPELAPRSRTKRFSAKIGKLISGRV